MGTTLREKNILTDCKNNYMGIKICQKLSSQGKEGKATKRATDYRRNLKCKGLLGKKGTKQDNGNQTNTRVQS